MRGSQRGSGERLLRVCLVSYEFPPSGGGEATYVSGLANGLTKMGHEVTLLTPHDPHVGASDRAFRIVPIGPGRPPLRGAGFLSEVGAKVSSLARGGQVDVVHVAFDYPTFFVRLDRTVPCVATVHHLHKVEALSMLPFQANALQKGILLLKGSILTSLEGSLVRQCSAVIAVSRFTAESVRRHLAVKAGRISLVQNGIDASEFEDGNPERFRREFPRLGEKIVLFVGRLERSKGLDYLIPAFASVNSRVEGATLAIVGSGSESYVNELKARARAVGVGDRVFFTGRISQRLLVDAYAASSLVVLPSLMEGFGLTVLQSMAAGKPCVATRVGAIPEIVRDGESGLLVNPADPRELGDAIARVLLDPGLATALGRKGKETVRSDYTLETMVRRTVEVYKGLMAGRGR